MRNVRCQEISIILASNLAGKIAGGKLKLVALGAFVCELVGLLLQQLECIVLVDPFALRRGDVVPGPLPELAAAYFGSGGIFLLFFEPGIISESVLPTFSSNICSF